MKPASQWMSELDDLPPSNPPVFDTHALITAIQDDARAQGMRDATEIIDKLKLRVRQLEDAIEDLKEDAKNGWA